MRLDVARRLVTERCLIYKYKEKSWNFTAYEIFLVTNLLSEKNKLPFGLPTDVEKKAPKELTFCVLGSI